MGLSTVGGGLMKSKLQLANATESNVISGKKFYAGDKTLKTGTLPDKGTWNGTYSGNNVTIPYGRHSGSGNVGVAGGNRGAWGSTIDPGSSIAIPQGYHNGSGRVYANPASNKVRVETGRETWNFNNNGQQNPWRKTFSGSIFAFGLTNVDQDGGNTSVQSQTGNSVTVVNYSASVVTFEWIAAYYV